MGSWIEELERRESAVRERIEGLRRQIAELTERLAVEEGRLSRLEITRETMREILAGPGQADAPQPGIDSAGEEPVASGSPIGVVTVPVWRAGMDAGVLPVAYRDILEVLVDAGQPLRAKAIAAGLGLPTEASKVEGLRSQLKRLAERGWLAEQVPGSFTPAAGTRTTAGQPPAQLPAWLPVEAAGSSSVSSTVEPGPNRLEEEPGATVRYEPGS